MAPFKGSISQREVQWVKLGDSCTYNKICYFRRTRSLVNLAHGINIIGQFLMISAKNRYDDLQDKTIPKFLDARIDTNNLLSSLTFGISIPIAECDRLYGLPFLPEVPTDAKAGGRAWQNRVADGVAPWLAGPSFGQGSLRSAWIAEAGSPEPLFTLLKSGCS
ncbi:hypothetical protein AtubIFM57258_011002 [Aspergillus tubingensis]|nr:hypothetical protein AtubIFM57258_011002 [Aspergillus tubingensis]